MSCTCFSFPDRMCACHLPFTSHLDCLCSCPSDSPTRGGGNDTKWPSVADLREVIDGWWNKVLHR